MKQRSVIVTTILLAAVLLPLFGCTCDNPEEHAIPTDNQTEETATDSPVSGPGFVTIYINRANHYENFEEAAAAADIIVTGTVISQEIVNLSEAWGWEGPGEMYGTDSVLEVGKRIKGDTNNEITVSQEGAQDWGAESGNPVFNVGEQCLLFLNRTEEGKYYLLDPNFRFTIEDEAVSSLNFVLPMGQARPPLDLQFWKVELSEFIGRIIDAAKAGFVTPEGTPVISMNLWKVMGGTNDELSIYADGTVIYLKEWGLRMASPDRPVTWAWRSGKLTGEEMAELSKIITSEAFVSMEGNESETSRDTFVSLDYRGDMTCKIEINFAGIDRSIIAVRYTTPDRGLTYPAMPDPLSNLYTSLKSIGENQTSEVYREELPSDAVIVSEGEDG